MQNKNRKTLSGSASNEGLDGKTWPYNARSKDIERVRGCSKQNKPDSFFIGVKFGRLIPVKRAKSEHSHRMFLCKCDCGRTKIMSATNLVSQKQPSCGKPGCRLGTTHGLSKKSRSYVRWKTMMARCYNPKHDNYSRYGGSGIKVCDQWHVFEGFLKSMGEPPLGKVLDRKDSKKGYSPENCRWVTFKESTENRKNTLWINGFRVPFLARKLKMPASRIYSRIKLGWSFDEIVKYKKGTRKGFNRFGIPASKKTIQTTNT